MMTAAGDAAGSALAWMLLPWMPLAVLAGLAGLPLAVVVTAGLVTVLLLLFDMAVVG